MGAEPPFASEVRVSGTRIAAVSRDGSPLPRGGARVVEVSGCTLLPGLTEAHAHLTWPSSVERPSASLHLPPEELALTAARNARILVDHGFAFPIYESRGDDTPLEPGMQLGVSAGLGGLALDGRF